MAEYDYQLKFVVDRPADCREVEAYLAAFRRDRPPAGSCSCPKAPTPTALAAKAAWLEPYCREHGFHFCPRRQIEWFGAERGR